MAWPVAGVKGSIRQRSGAGTAAWERHMRVGSKGSGDLGREPPRDSCRGRADKSAPDWRWKKRSSLRARTGLAVCGDRDPGKKSTSEERGQFWNNGVSEHKAKKRPISL